MKCGWSKYPQSRATSLQLTERPRLILSSTVWNLLTRQKSFGAIPTCCLKSSMKRRELKPVLFATSAIFEVAGWAKKFSTAYSTTGCPSNMPAARSSSATSTTRNFSAGVGAARTRSRSSLARRPKGHRGPHAGCAVRRSEVSGRELHPLDETICRSRRSVHRCRSQNTWCAGR